jgi:hypothetical protein
MSIRFYRRIKLGFRFSVNINRFGPRLDAGRLCFRISNSLSVTLLVAYS